jgi:hypothetical protein
LREVADAAVEDERRDRRHPDDGAAKVYPDEPSTPARAKPTFTVCRPRR